MTARELALARRAAVLALRERELAEAQAVPSPSVPPPPANDVAVADTVADTVADEVAPTDADEVAETDADGEVAEPERAEPFVQPAPGSWTIGAVELLLAQEGPAFPDRVEELGYFVDSFRDVAEADGRLPAGVEIVVEDVFAELIDRARSATT